MTKPCSNVNFIRLNIDVKSIVYKENTNREIK